MNYCSKGLDIAIIYSNDKEHSNSYLKTGKWVKTWSKTLPSKLVNRTGKLYIGRQSYTLKGQH